mgnify:FL=1
MTTTSTEIKQRLTTLAKLPMNNGRFIDLPPPRVKHLCVLLFWTQDQQLLGFTPGTINATNFTVPRAVACYNWHGEKEKKA